MLEQGTTRTVRQSCDRFPGHPKDPTQALAGTQRIIWRNTQTEQSRRLEEKKHSTCRIPLNKRAQQVIL